MRSIFICLCVSAAILLSSAACSRSPQTYLETGNRLFQEGKYPDAALNYQKALQRDAKFAEAHYRLGLVLLKQTKIREAMDSFAQAVELAPAHEEAVGKLADILLTIYLQDLNRPEFLYTRLTRLSEQAFKQNPRSFEGFRIQGFLRMTDHKPEESVKAFKQALEVRPYNPDISLAMIRPLLDLKQMDEAEKIALASIEKNKEFGQLYDVLYLMYGTEGRQADALKILQTKISNNPTNSDFAIQLCYYYFQFKKGPELAATINRLSDTKNYPDGPLKIGEFYSRLHNWKEAAAQVEIGIRTQPEKKAVYQKLMMRILLEQRKFDEARAISETILKDDPKDTVALGVRGTLDMSKRETIDTASKDFQTLVSLEPRNPIYRFHLGRIYHLKGDLPKARAEYNESSKLRAGYLPPLMGLAEMNFEQRDYAGAITQLKAIMKVDPKNPEPRTMMSAALMGLGDYDKAATELQAVLKDFPKYGPAEVQYAYIQVHDKHYPEAEQLFKKYYQPGSGNLRVLTGLVELNIAQGRGEAALNLIREDLKTASFKPPLQDLLAFTAIRLQQYGVAIEELKQMVAAQPNSTTLLSKLGEAYRLSGDKTNAIAYYQKAADLAPKQIGPTVMLAYVLSTSGHMQEAVSRYQQALATAPDDPVILNNLAVALAKTDGTLDEGMKHAQRALMKDPNNPHVKDTVGWLYARMNKHDSAIQILDGLTRKYPKDPTYRYHLGYAMLKKGQKQEAKNQLTIALSNTPEKEDAAEIKKLLDGI